MTDRNELNKHRSLVSNAIKSDDEILKVNTSSTVLGNCKICYEKPISHVISCCGHCFCENCIDNMRSKCAMCNKTFNSSNNKVKIYLDIDEDDVQPSLEILPNEEGISNRYSEIDMLEVVTESLLFNS